MTVLKKKVSELPVADNIDGLTAFGVDNTNKSVQISLQFVKDAADAAQAQADRISSIEVITSVRANDKTYNEVTL